MNTMKNGLAVMIWADYLVIDVNNPDFIGNKKEDCSHLLEKVDLEVNRLFIYNIRYKLHES